MSKITLDLMREFFPSYDDGTLMDFMYAIENGEPVYKNEETGVYKTLHFDGEQFYLGTHTPINALADDNKEAVKDSTYDRWGDGKVTGRIPLSVMFSTGLDKAFKQNDAKYVRKFLTENPQFRRFRSVG